jgi:hypothetical protein
LPMAFRVDGCGDVGANGEYRSVQRTKNGARVYMRSNGFVLSREIIEGKAGWIIGKDQVSVGIRAALFLLFPFLLFILLWTHPPPLPIFSCSFSLPFYTAILHAIMHTRIMHISYTRVNVCMYVVCEISALLTCANVSASILWNSGEKGKWERDEGTRFRGRVFAAIDRLARV